MLARSVGGILGGVRPVHFIGKGDFVSGTLVSKGSQCVIQCALGVSSSSLCRKPSSGELMVTSLTIWKTRWLHSQVSTILSQKKREAFLQTT